MARYVLMTLTKPEGGREKEYNEWYDGTHLGDVLAIDGVKSAQRFRLAEGLSPGAAALPYLALYEIETDDVARVIEDLKTRTATGRMQISPALSSEIFAAAYEVLGPAVPRA